MRFFSRLAGLAMLASFVLQAPAGSLPQIKLTTSLAGIHRVTTGSLANLLGLTPDEVSNRLAQGQFALLNQGQPAGWVLDPGGSELLFYAQPRHNNYTDQNVYWLVDGTNQTPQVDGAAPAPQTTGYYFAATNIAQYVYCRYDLATNPDSNYWYWANLVGSHPFRGSFNNTFTLDAPGPTNLTAWITVNVYGFTGTNHGVSLMLNGVTNAAWVGTWSNLQPASFTFAVPSALLGQTNTVRVTALGTFASQWWLAGWQITYPRTYLATAGRLLCGANSNSVVTLNGFTNSSITVLDVTQPLAPLLVTNLTLAQTSGGWQASFVPLQPNANYAICQAGAELDVTAMEAVWPQGLASPTNRAAFVIIAPTNLLAASQALADYRNQQGLETRLISLESVYNEFDAGLREPAAISSFLACAGQQWIVTPTYALLVGNGTYDYRNEFGVGDNLVPPLMVPTLYGLAASDSSYGQISSAPGPQIAVGRLPVTNAVQLAALITKIQNYEQTPVPGRVGVLLADVADPAAGNFPEDISGVQAVLAGAFTTQMISPVNTATNTAVMRSELLTNLQAGADLFCYVGHGAAQELGDAGYLTTSDVATLTNTARLPLVSAITCLAGFFAQPGYTCLGGALVLPAQSGAIASLSCSGFSLDSEAMVLNMGLMTTLAAGTPGRLGDFVRNAMVGYNQTARFTPSAEYNLQGDPSLLYRGSPAPPNQPPWIAGLSQNGVGGGGGGGGEGITLTLAAQPGQVYSLLATTNLSLPLTSWSVVSTGIVPFGAFNLSDLTATNYPQRFYQLVTHPQ